MNKYTKTERDRRRIEREHFMLYRWHFVPECRKWERADIVLRLKLEGLLSYKTNAVDCSAVAQFWRELKAAASI